MTKLNKACLIGLLVASLLLAMAKLAWAEPTAQDSPVHWHQVALQGKVRAIEDTTITVASRRGRIALLTDETTRLCMYDDDQGSLADIHIDDRIAVRGRLAGVRVVRAQTIFVIPEGIRILRGEVTAIDSNGLGLNTRHGELRVMVDNYTRFRIPGVKEPGLNDLRVGTRAFVAGFWNDDGSVLAKTVAALPQQPQLGRAIGRVTAMADLAINLKLRSGRQISVQTDDLTRFLPAGGKVRGLNDLEVGQLIGVSGHWEESGRLHARIIIVPHIPPASPEGGG